MYPDLNPEPILKTLEELWNFAAGTAAITSPERTYNSISGGRRNTHVLRPPSCSPPPPPCQLDGVEYELETTSLLDKTITEANVNEFEPNNLTSEVNTMEHSLTSVNLQLHDITNNYPYPDLVPEAFSNPFQKRLLLASNQLHQTDESNYGSSITRRNIESIFLITVFCSTMLLLYLFPAYDPSLDY